MVERFHTFRGFVDYGGPGSGNFGHAGRAGKTGGSAPKSGAGAAVSIEKGRTAEARQAAAAGKSLPKPVEKPASVTSSFKEISDLSDESLRNASAEIKKTVPNFSNIYIIRSPAAGKEKITLDSINETGAQLVHLKENYPKMNDLLEGRAFFRYLEINTLDKGTLAEYDKVYDKITYSNGKNGVSSKRVSRNLQKVTPGKWSGCNDLSGTVRHEIGHAVQHRISGSTRRNWNVVYGSMSTKTISKQISKYGSKNAQEAFSESFAMYTSPVYKSSSKKLPKDVDNYFKNLLGA